MTFWKRPGAPTVSRGRDQMTSVTLANTYPAGYPIKPGVTYVTIATTGSVGGTGVVGPNAATAAYTIVNLGVVSGSSLGTAGVKLDDGGNITNGSPSDAAIGRIQGYVFGVDITAGLASVYNYGQILTTELGAAGVVLGGGGYVLNGANGLISSAQGVKVEGETPGSVVNLGTIVGVKGQGNAGVYLTDGGSVTNGSAGDLSAEIEGSIGVEVTSAVGTVTNFGAIVSNSGTYSGVDLSSGGSVTNGTAVDDGALISGKDGVYLSGLLPSTVFNFGSIEGGDSPIGGTEGVVLDTGGSVTNGSATDRVALIEGFDGIYVAGAAGAVTNFATILGKGGAGGVGVDLTDGGSLTNGAINDKSALVEGFEGAELVGAGSSVNFGKIEGLGNGTLGPASLWGSAPV